MSLGEIFPKKYIFFTPSLTSLGVAGYGWLFRNISVPRFADGTFPNLILTGRDRLTGHDSTKPKQEKVYRIKYNPIFALSCLIC